MPDTRSNNDIKHKEAVAMHAARVIEVAREKSSSSSKSSLSHRDILKRRRRSKMLQYLLYSTAWENILGSPQLLRGRLYRTHYSSSA